MGSPAARLLTIFQLECPFFYLKIVFRLEMTAFGWGLLRFIKLASNTCLAALQTLRRIIFMLACPFGCRDIGGLIVIGF